MAEATATARGSARTLDAAPDSPDRTFKTYEEVAEAVRLDAMRRKVRPYSNVINNVARLVMELQKWKAMGGDGTISSGQLIGAMYDDVTTNPDDRERKRASVQRWMKCAGRVGAIAYEPLPGKSRGWSYTLLPVGQLAGYADETGRRSSVGETSLFARRRETRCERQDRRVAPFRRRAGRNGVGRLVWAHKARPGEAEPPRPLFSAPRFDPARAEGGEIPLRGSLPPSAEEGPDAREPSPAAPAWAAALVPWLQPGSWPTAGGGRDAIERACPPDQLAALRALRSSGLRGGSLEPLRRAAVQAGPQWAAAFALAAWATAWSLAGHPGREPRFSRDTAVQLDRSARQLDRLGGGRPWACSALVADIADVALGDPETGEVIGTLAYYVVSLKATARHLRRQRRGMPAPRRHRPRGRR